MNEAYCMDCMSYMATLPDKEFDLAIVDPPYGIGNFVQTSGNVRGEAVKWNDFTPTQDYFLELKRVSKEQIIWGARKISFYDNRRRIELNAERRLKAYAKNKAGTVSAGRTDRP